MDLCECPESLPDAVAKVLAKHYSFRVNGRVEDKVVLPIAAEEISASTSNGHATNGNGLNGHTKSITMADGGEDSAQQLTLAAPLTHEGPSTSLFDICPECGTGSFAYEEGCKKCYSCGYSEC